MPVLNQRGGTTPVPATDSGCSHPGFRWQKGQRLLLPPILGAPTPIFGGRKWGLGGATQNEGVGRWGGTSRQRRVGPMNVDDPDLWEQNATWWQDGFTDGADPEYVEQIVPIAAELLRGSERILDVGAGEGQLARIAAAQGSQVVASDVTWNQILVAKQRGGGPSFVRNGAAQLPFADGSFDAVLACLVFEHISDVDDAINEVARVLEPGGRFVFMLNHPLLQTPNSGWIDDQILDPPEQYWRIGDYLIEAETIEEVQKDVFIPFIHRPLSRYVNAMAEAGMLIQRMIEPAPPSGFLERATEYEAAATIPRLLVLDAVKAST